MVALETLYILSRHGPTWSDFDGPALFEQLLDLLLSNGPNLEHDNVKMILLKILTNTGFHLGEFLPGFTFGHSGVHFYPISVEGEFYPIQTIKKIILGSKLEKVYLKYGEDFEEYLKLHFKSNNYFAQYLILRIIHQGKYFRYFYISTFMNFWVHLANKLEKRQLANSI